MGDHLQIKGKTSLKMLIQVTINWHTICTGPIFLFLRALTIIPSVDKAAGRSKVVVLLLWIYCLMYFSLFARVLCLFCYALHYVHSRFEIILKGKRKLLVFSYRCFVTFNVLRPFFTVPLVGLLYVIVVFPVHSHL